MDLEESRRQIDQIDSDLIRLFNMRMQTVSNIIDIKIRDNLPVFNRGRENEILNNAAASASPELAGYINSYLNYIMELSKNRQREILRERCQNPENSFHRLIHQKKDEIKKPRVAVQGIKGSYSTAAAQRLYPDGCISYTNRWNQVFTEIACGDADYGILPLENSLAGSVTEVFDLLLHHNLYIVKSVPVNIHHCLLGVRGSNLNGVKQVYSHPHAFPQCSKFLSKHYWLEKVPYINTALAAEKIAIDGDKGKAAIASRDCAHLYGLDVLCDAIEDNHSNCTRFISISKSIEISENANKISIIFTLPHVTGSLYRMLGRFALKGLNITKIESRPIPDRNFEYYFYLDLIGSVRNPAVEALLSSLSEELSTFYFLGNYSD